jgi:hypothetical protein
MLCCKKQYREGEMLNTSSGRGRQAMGDDS